MPGLRWLTVVLPVVLIGAVEVLADQRFDQVIPSPFDVLPVPIAVLVLSLAFARLAFRRIDRLTVRIRDRNTELERRNASLEALAGLSARMTASPPIGEVLVVIADAARSLLRCDVAFLTRELPDGTREVLASSPSGAAPARLDALPGRVDAPLRRGDSVIGTLSVGCVDGRAFGPGESEILVALASQAAIAIETDRLQGQLRELAIQGERERIAREMHDGLAQVLGYVNTKAQAVEELLAADQLERARQQLAELAAAARSVYVDVREAILGLHSPIDPERGLVAALDDYARKFADASKLAMRVDASGAAREVELSPEVEAQVFRIVQEALSNVRKHAVAHWAALAIDVSGHRLRIAVRDDGVGFDPAARPVDGWPRYGLQAMRERANAIGATLAWTTDGGAGTVLELVVPVVGGSG